MAKKTWIKLKRGLLEPKHREALGVRIWLYLYILDNTDWGTGKMIEWRDADAADALQMPQRTVRDQRVKLEEDGYIQCQQGLHKQIITVMNWTDPRLHSDDKMNIPAEMSNGDNNLTPLANSVHGDIHGDIHGYMKLDTPTSNPQVTCHSAEQKFESLSNSFTNITGLVLNRVPANRKTWDDTIKFWLERNYTPSMIQEAVKVLKSSGKYTLSGPWSLTNTLANIAMEQDNEPEQREEPTMRKAILPDGQIVEVMV